MFTLELLLASNIIFFLLSNTCYFVIFMLYNVIFLWCFLRFFFVGLDLMVEWFSKNQTNQCITLMMWTQENKKRRHIVEGLFAWRFGTIGVRWWSVEPSHGLLNARLTTGPDYWVSFVQSRNQECPKTKSNKLWLLKRIQW